MDTTTEARATSYEVLEQFLAGYWTTRTRDSYRFILTRWLDWCHANGLNPVGGAAAAALEAFIAELKTAGYAPNTIVGRVSAVSAFYRWCVREQLVVRHSVEMIRRPSRPAESATASLTRHQLTDWLAAVEHRGGAWWAAAMLLGLNGLPCGELIACNVEDVGNHSWHHTLKLTTTKGDRPTVVALAPPTMQAVALAINGRDRGPLLRNRAGRRMTAYNVQYLVGAIARDAAIPAHLTPHGLRHSAITISTPGCRCATCRTSPAMPIPRPLAATTAPDTPPTQSPTNSPAATEQPVLTTVLRAKDRTAGGALT